MSYSLKTYYNQISGYFYYENKFDDEQNAEDGGDDGDVDDDCNDHSQ